VETLLVVQSAGAVLSGSVRHKLQSLLPDVMIMNNFGSSESGHQGSAFYDEDEGEDARPQWFMKDNVVVIDEHFSRITPGSGAVGRLARTGPLPLGYYKDPEKTAATFVEFEGRRWVIPGDMATVEEDGTVTFLGRGSVCINSGGEKVYPEEVEEALKAHPSIFDALVVGLADERWGQRVEAVISLREGHALTEDEVRAFCRQRLAGYKVPRRVHRVPEVVRHPSGKPDYKWAREVAGG
jgi:acyl-CoA synthetase (AMP-forming)/AMP-acid ligase II